MARTELLDGNIRRQLIRLSVPLLIGSILQQLYNTVDSLIISNFLGEAAFSAVGIAGTVMNLVIFVIIGFCTGVSIILGQQYGAGDRAGFRREVFVSVTLGGSITLVLTGLFLCLMRPILKLINSPDELVPLIEGYLTVIIGGMLTTYFYNLFSGLLRAIGDTRASSIFLLVSVVVNGFTDYLLVGILHMGVSGAAWATVFSQFLSAVLCLVYIVRRDRDLICTRRDFRFDPPLVRRTLTYGFTNALHQSSLYIGKILVQGAVNTLGTPGIAAYAATTRIEGFANSFGLAVGQSVSVITAQNYGAGKMDRVRGGFREAITISAVMGLIFSVLLYAAALPGVRLFLKSDVAESTGYGVAYLRMIAYFYLLCFSGNAFAGWFRGVSRLRVTLACTTMHVSIRVILSYLLVSLIGLRAVALGTGMGWLILAVVQVVLYRRVSKEIDSEIG